MIIDWKIIAKIIITYLEQRPKWLHGENLPSDQKPLFTMHSSNPQYQHTNSSDWSTYTSEKNF